MNKNSFLTLSSFFILFCSCNNNKTGTHTANDPTTAKTVPVFKDTTKLSPTTILTDTQAPGKNNPVTKETALKETIHQSPALKSHLKRLKEEWKNTPNPIIATYEGNHFGDYQHILFKDSKGNTYDFGQAANHYGKFKLHNLSGQYEDNPAYLGKKFKVYWEWKIADFLCCEGDYDKSKGYLPAITKLELIKK